MRHPAEYAILTLYCFFSLSFVPIDVSFVAAFLCAFCLLALSVFSDSSRAVTITGIFFAGLCLFFPDFFLWIPAVLCIGFYQLNYIYLCAFLPALLQYLIFGLLFTPASQSLPTLLSSQPFSVSLVFYLLFGIFLSFILSLFFRRYEALQTLCRTTRDTETERNLLLHQRNQAILEKQDYEIYSATLKERNRIAREIHDNVGHVLSRSILMVGALKTVNQSPELSSSLDVLDQSLNQAMNSIRSSVHDLHEEAEDLEHSLKLLLDQFRFCPVSFQYEMSRAIPPELKYCFIGIVKEALSNIIRHSHATEVSISCIEHPGLYQLKISDNGTAGSSISSPRPPRNTDSMLPGSRATEFSDSSKTRVDSVESVEGTSFTNHRSDPDTGIGLTNIRERTEALGGTLQITEDHGFHIFIMIPKPIPSS